MSRSIPIAVLCWLALSGSILAAGWDTLVFQYDFATAPPGALDSNVWIINHPGSWWWTQGRTLFPNYGTWYPDWEFPSVQNGACVINHHLYDPQDNGNPKTTFLGGEIRTILQFQPNRSYRFEATVRCHPYPNGLVTSFFLYGWDGAHSDEIDFEFLSNKTNDNVHYPNGDPVSLNTWNESNQKQSYAAPAGLVLNDWNTFRIYWYTALHRVDWTWLDPVHGEILLRSETDTFFVPNETMALYFNFWAPDSDWADAYSSALQPVNSQSQDQAVPYEIQRVEVYALTVAAADFDGDGDVDADDLAALLACTAGSATPYPSGCAAKDLDQDGDVDQADFGLFQRCYSGPRNNPPPGC